MEGDRGGTNLDPTFFGGRREGLNVVTDIPDGNGEDPWFEREEKREVGGNDGWRSRMTRRREDLPYFVTVYLRIHSVSVH